MNRESPIEFRLAAEHRRCAWYVAAGVVCVFGLAAWLKLNGLVADQSGWTAYFIGVGVSLLAACALLVVTHRWRLRVDGEGLARRRFWKWDVWTWEEFTSGRIQWVGGGFISTARPWWRKEMPFAFLREEDRAFVLAACKLFFQPTDDEPYEIPRGEIVLQYMLFCKLTLREDGIAGYDRRYASFLRWADIEQVRLYYFDHESKDLRRIEFEAPGRRLRIEALNKISGRSLGTVRVVDPKIIPQVIGDYLRKHAPAEKLVRHALRGPPQTLGECEHRVMLLRKELRKLTWFYRIVPAVCLLATSLCMGPKAFAAWQKEGAFPDVRWLVLATILLAATILSQPLLIWAVLRERRTQAAKALRELVAWRETHAEPQPARDRFAQVR